MGLSVWPAPEDSGIVGPTGATGPQGPKGDTGATGAKGATGATGPAGTPGSQVLTGTAAPTASIGVDGDLYIQDDTRTFLGVTNTTLTHWKKTAGAWSQVGQPVGGSKWYTNTTTTSSTDTKPGDMLLRTDTGDIWQRSASGWGAPIGNLKGPKGDTGAQGPKGDKGDPGDGNVNTVNGKTGPDITLAAGDLGAISATGNTTVNAYLRGNGSAAPLNVYGNNTDDRRFAVLSSGNWYSNALGNTAYNMGIGDTLTQFGGGTFVLGIRNANVVPTTTPTNGAIVYAEGGKVKVLQTDGQVVTVGASGGAKNTWTPQALGFRAWSVDPATVANPKNWNATSGGIIKAASIQRMYLAGMNITEPTTVSKVVMFARGWGGSSLVPNARFMAGIYDSTGKRLVHTGDTALSNVPAAGQQAGTPGDAKNNHIGAVPFSLTASYTLQPGLYWAAFLMPAGGSTDFYYMHIENESPSNPSNFHLLGTAFMRAGYIAGQSTLPTSFTPSSMKLDHDPCIMALA